jgi:hypothetical protein
MLGGLPAKCFGQIVKDLAACAHEKPIIVSGHFDAHGNEIEFAVKKVIGAALSLITAVMQRC